MLHYFKKENFDIVLLQETHTSSHAMPSLTVQFLAALGWQIHHSGHTNSSAGVAILIQTDLLQNPFFKLCGSNAYRDSALPGRLLSIWFIWNRRHTSYTTYTVHAARSTKRLEAKDSMLRNTISAIYCVQQQKTGQWKHNCLLYTSPSPRDISGSRMPSSA